MSWTTFSTDAPELADRIRARFEAHLHHVLATIRAYGSPRVSGTEVRWYDADQPAVLLADLKAWSLTNAPGWW